MTAETKTIRFEIDGRRIEAQAGETIIEAADHAGIYIPRLCHKPGLQPYGGCRLCTVLMDGRPCSACTQPATNGSVIENDTEEVNQYRKGIIEMLFVEGNHFCMACEKSGNCELQAVAYRFGIAAPRFPHQNPEREIDASHPDIIIDHNRCILCARCKRTAAEVDGKEVFGFAGRGPGKRLIVNSVDGLGGTAIEVTDAALDACPVGALMRKRVGFRVPVGSRLFDTAPIGTDIENQEQDTPREVKS